MILHNGKILYENTTDIIKSSYFKVQTAYDEPKREDVFEGLEILEKTKQGFVFELTVKGDRAEITEKLKETQPVLLDIMPLSLEEFFVYELKTQGYTADPVKGGLR